MEGSSVKAMMLMTCLVFPPSVVIRLSLSGGEKEIEIGLRGERGYACFSPFFFFFNLGKWRGREESDG